MIRYSISVLLLLLFVLQKPLSAQDFGGFLSLDMRGGYSGNSMMMPFHGEWNREAPSLYGLAVPSATLTFDRGRISTELTGGGFFETFTNVDRHTLRGLYGLWNLRYNLNRGWYAGIETGGQTANMGYGRNSGWLVPWVGWQPDLFTNVRLKSGSSFRRYRNRNREDQIDEGSSRFDLYMLEVERWLGFRWQVRGVLSGNLDDPGGTVSLSAALNHLLTNRFRAGFRMTMNQFSYQMGYQDNATPESIVVIDETDRLWRSGLQARYQWTESVSVSVSADHMMLSSATSNQNLHDIHLSAGVRFSIRPGSGRDMVATPDREVVRGDVIELNIRYRGDGELYLIGDFNDWREPGVPLMNIGRNRYAAEMSLSPGGYEYKVLLIGEDGERTWIEFSDDTYTVPDGFGGENGVIFID